MAAFNCASVVVRVLLPRSIVLLVSVCASVRKTNSCVAPAMRANHPETVFQTLPLVGDDGAAPGGIISASCPLAGVAVVSAPVIAPPFFAR